MEQIIIHSIQFIIFLAFVWLGIETKGLTINIVLGGNQAPQSKSRGIETSLNSPAPCPSDSKPDTIPYKPTEFIPLDMPATEGNLNIICVRE